MEMKGEGGDEEESWTWNGGDRNDLPSVGAG